MSVYLHSQCLMPCATPGLIHGHVGVFTVLFIFFSNVGESFCSLCLYLLEIFSRLCPVQRGQSKQGARNWFVSDPSATGLF